MNVPDVTIESWPQLALPRQEVQPALQYLAHKCQKPVSFRWYTEGEGYSPHSVSVRVVVHDGLRPIYSLPRVQIRGADHLLAPGQKAEAMALVHPEWKAILDELDQIVGLVDHNRVLIPVEITAADNEAARSILAYVLEQALALLDFDVAGVLREKEEVFTAHFTQAFAQSVRSRLGQRQEEFDQRKREAEQAYYQLLDFERERPVMEQEIALLGQLVEKPQSKLARQQAQALLQVQQTGQYSSVLLNGEGTVIAITSPITIEHDGYDFPVGRYEISLPTNGDIRIKALDDHPNADHPHPHVARDYRPCLGNISGDIAKLIGRMRFAEALQLLHSFLSSYNPENPYEKIGRFDPSGYYQDEDDDPCQDCDDKCTPYCIFSCEHNHDIYTCSDCCDHRSEFCYEECEHNQDHERFHPCEDCTRKGEAHCYLKCRYNKEWELQNPCDDCEEECDENCEYHQKGEESGHVQAKTEAR